MALRERLFRDRRDAGRILARAIQGLPLEDYSDGIVLALPRGGVPVGYEVARALGLPLDILLVRKLGVPGFEELAMGAVASDGTIFINPAVLAEYRIPQNVLDAVTEREKLEIQRTERVYRNGRPPVAIDGRMVILVDDGLATGASMLAAIQAVRKRARKVLAAVPVAASDTCRQLRGEADTVICAREPVVFPSVGAFYLDFEQTTDTEVRELLAKDTEPVGQR